MILNGMSIARVNLTHGDLAQHAQAIQSIRAAAEAVGHPVAIWGDLPGLKVRIGRLAADSVWLRAGQGFLLQTKKVLGDATRASLSIAGLPGAVKPGDRIHLNDGLILLEAQEVAGEEIYCRVIAGGELRSGDGANLPGVDLGMSTLTSRDRACLAFAAEQRLDAISPSFIQDAADLVAIRQEAADMNYAPFLLAKIEREAAVQNLEAILEQADAVVVARGDLGMETPLEEIALLQKHIIRMANHVGKPAITATHMLESMTHQRLPTRAEVADVTNAVLDGTDCLTLSAETALGHHPAETVSMMARIARATEQHVDRHLAAMAQDGGVTGQMAGAENDQLLGVKDIVQKQRPAVVLARTAKRATAHQLSRLRLPTWVVAVCPDEATCRVLQFSYGVRPVHRAVSSEEWGQIAPD
jgi:pyruvate kinase